MSPVPGRTGLPSRIGALALLAGLLAGLPVALVLFGSAYLPAAVPSWAEVTAALSGPDTGALFLGLLVVVGWIAWAAFAVGVAVEVPAQLRGLASPRLPGGLGGPQRLAGLMVAAVLGAGPLPMLAVPASAHAAQAATTPPSAAPNASPPSMSDTTQATAVTMAPPAAQGTGNRYAGPTYTVQSRDTLGRIAARILGDWQRFEELLELNRGRPQPDGGQLTDSGVLRAGWVLELPADATVEPGPHQLVVEPGDTLSAIAHEHGMTDWRPLFELNEGEPQLGGRRFTDPDLIFPGQILTLPAPADGSTPAPSTPSLPAPQEPPTPSTAPSSSTAPTAPATTAPAPSSTASQTSASTSPAPAIDHTSPGAHENAAKAAPPVVALLAGAGALLAGCLSGLLLLHRRQRMRRRARGRALAPVPDSLRPTEAALSSTAASDGADPATLDYALRALSVAVSDQPGCRLPDVLAARLTRDRLELRLAAPAQTPPPAPWVADRTGMWWSLDLTADLGVPAERARGRLAPYPALVSVGETRDARWLLDLEGIGVLRLHGSAQRRTDFCRHLAAELAVNRWSDLLWVTVVGFGAELHDLDPSRVSTSATARETMPTLCQRLDAHAEQPAGAVLDGRLRAHTGDGWMPTVVVAPGPSADATDLTELAVTIEQRGQRSPVAVVLGSDADDGVLGWRAELTEAGTLILPALDQELRAYQLREQEAADIAALVGFERDGGDVDLPDRSAPRHRRAEDPLDPVLSSSPEGVSPPGCGSGASEHSCDGESMGPASATGSTTSAVHAPPAAMEPNGVAPVTAAPDAHQEALDRALDEWWDDASTRPKLTLLGPIRLRAHGDEQAVTRSGLRRRYEEVVAYLATRPNGATVEEAAEALRPDMGDPISARAYVHRVTAGARVWMGDDPETGERYLGWGHRGSYQLRGVLVDAGLFDELRARASKLGPAGRKDLLAALRLVSGPPFSQRPSGYEWLQGLDLGYTAAVCDVAHQVVHAALDDNDLAAARAASATALRVAGDDENVLLDAMWVAYRSGNRAEAEAFVQRIVDANDGEDEMDLHLSTAEAITRARREFLSRAS